jgi:phospholipase/lecithinase/hemolysin
LELVPGIRVLHQIDEMETGLYVSIFNYHLQKMAKRFRETNPHTKVSLITVEDIFWDAVMRPEDYGAADSTCWSHEGQNCVSPIACIHPLRRSNEFLKLWWDGFHPARAIHRVIGHRAAEAVWGESIKSF